jgi:hypothetical protein
MRKKDALAGVLERTKTKTNLAKSLREIDFIDAVRSGKAGGGSLTPTQRIRFETEARRAAPAYGINPDLAPGILANKFDTLLSRSAQKRGKPLGAYLNR